VYDNAKIWLNLGNNSIIFGLTDPGSISRAVALARSGRVYYYDGRCQAIPPAMKPPDGFEFDYEFNNE
jgi:hypothetical protein